MARAVLGLRRTENPLVNAPQHYHLDQRLRMVATDHGELAARVAAARPNDYATFRHTGTDLLLLGRYEDALDHLDRALQLADTDRRRIAVWINLGDVYRYSGDTVAAETLYLRALGLARVGVDAAPVGASSPGAVPSGAESASGGAARNVYTASDALPLSGDAASGDTEILSFALQHLGKALAEQGRLTEARVYLTEALHLRIEVGDVELIESSREALHGLADLTVAMPPSVAALLGESPEFSDEHEGQSGGVVLVNGRYWLKRGPEATGEHARLIWLRDNGIAVPQVAVFEDDVLVLADAGSPSVATEFESPGRAGESPGAFLGAVLRRLHELPIADCPFDARLDATLALARRRTVEGLVDTDDFDDDNAGLGAEHVLDRLLTERPAIEDLVVVHGDFTPSNVLANGILLDLSRLGVADRYRDLALAERDLADDFGADEVPAFFAAYGLADPDRRRLDYYRLLDELF